MSESGNDLVSYFKEYGPQRFRSGGGKPLGRRSLQKKIIEFDLPIILVSKGDPLISPARGDAQLSKFTRGELQHRGRGRPRKA